MSGMKTLLYPIYAIASWMMTATAYFPMAFICPFFIGADGYYRGWFKLWGTPDNPATGDPEFWPKLHPTWSEYKLAWTWIWRNPAQGFDQLIAAPVTMDTPVKTWWEFGDNYLYTCKGAFHWSWRIGLATGGMGWRLNNIVKGYPHPTMGQIVTTILRFHR
jgi:hypothetical protein